MRILQAGRQFQIGVKEQFIKGERHDQHHGAEQE